MARLAGDIAAYAATPERLAVLQRDLLVPLELEMLAGRAELSTQFQCQQLPATPASPPWGRSTAGCTRGANGQPAPWRWRTDDPSGPRRKHTTG